MPPEFLSDVQNYCDEMMNTFGYTKFSDEKEMFDDELSPLIATEKVPFLFQF